MVKLNVEEIVPKEGYTPVSEFGLRDFADNSVDEIICEDFVHIVFDFIGLIQTMYLKLKPGSKAIIYAPYWNSVRAHQHPFVKRYINEGLFLPFNKQWRENEGKHLKLDLFADFDISFGYIFDPEFDTRSEIAKQYAAKYYNNVVVAFQVTLTKK